MDCEQRATQAAPRSSRQSAAGCRLADCHSHAAEPPHRVPPRPSIDIHVGKRAAARPTPRTDSRRQREPEGRSPAQSAGKAKRSDRRAREDYGWGWAGGVIKPDQVPSSATTPTTPGSASVTPRKRQCRVSAGVRPSAPASPASLR